LYRAGLHVKPIDVIEDMGTAQISCIIGEVLDLLFVRQTEERRGNGVILAVALSACAER
jgi:hypothetical protein